MAEKTSLSITEFPTKVGIPEYTCQAMPTAAGLVNGEESCEVKKPGQSFSCAKDHRLLVTFYREWLGPLRFSTLWFFIQLVGLCTVIISTAQHSTAI